MSAADRRDDPRHLDAVVERVLDEVRRQGGPAGGGVEATARADHHLLALTRFAGSGIHQNTEDDRTTVHLRIAVDGGRSASVSTTRTTTAALTELVSAAFAAARLSPRDPSWPGLAVPAPVPTGAGPDEATAAAGPAERAALVATFVEAAGGLETAGHAQTTVLTSVFADTAGQRAAATSTSATVDGIARAQPGSGLDAAPADASFRADGVGRATARALSDLDAAALGSRAARRARAQTAPAQPLRRGQLPVVLEPSAVLDVVAGLLSSTFNGRGVVEGTSGVRPGEQQLDPALTLLEDPLAPGSTALPFDAEGTPAHRVDLVRAGVPRSVTTDRRTAAALARSSRPHAGLPTTAGAHDASDTSGPVATAPALSPGAGGSVDDLVRGLEHGLLVCDLWYTRLAESKRSVWTGLTRNGTFLVRDGEVVGPVGVLRFTQSYLEALAPGAVVVGSHAEALPRALAFGAAGTAQVVVPALRLVRWNVTGGAAT